ncbi:MAG: hopanoid biosynthesis-associated protein HpnK [Desulfuromonadia bacterium]
MKRLIVTADDFGMSTSVNRGIEIAWREGILTSASLMVTGEAAAGAVETARRCPGLFVGLHLTLLQGKSAARHPEFPSLTDRQGFFGNDPVVGGMRLFFLKSLRKQIRREIEAQFERFLSFGLSLTHVDGHLNIHLHPTVLSLLLELAPRYGIRSIRLTREDLGRIRFRPSGNLVDAFLVNRLALRAEPCLRQRGIAHADEVRGVLESGRVDEGSLLRMIDTLGEGSTEFYCHPAWENDPVTAGWRPGYDGPRELRALTSREVVERIRAQGVLLGDYGGGEKRV